MKYKNFWNKIKSFDRDREIINSGFSLTENLINLSEYIERNYKINNSLRFYLKYCFTIAALVLSLLFLSKILPDNCNGFLFAFWLLTGVFFIVCSPSPGEAYTKKVFQLVKKDPTKIVEVVQKNIDNVQLQLSQSGQKQNDLYEKIRTYSPVQAKEYVQNHYYENIPYFELIKDETFMTVLSAEATKEIASIDQSILHLNEARIKLEEQKTFFNNLS